MSPQAFGDPVMAEGVVRVGLRLEPGRLPNSALPPGTSIQLIPVSREGAAVPAGGSVVGTTASAPALQTDGSTLIDVTVAAAAVNESPNSLPPATIDHPTRTGVAMSIFVLASAAHSPG